MFKNGKQDGLWTQWHDNGQKQAETQLEERQARWPLYLVA